jgi:RNA polymerase sigma factor (sigma-70 family)
MFPARQGERGGDAFGLELPGRPAAEASHCQSARFLVCSPPFRTLPTVGDRSLFKGDRDADAAAGLSSVFLENRQPLSAFLRARLGRGVDAAEVDDLMQELWLKACAVDPAGVDNPRSYLFRIAHNLVLNRSRDLARRRDREAAWGYMHGRDRDGVEAATAERGLVARERLAAIEEALRGVGERAARIFRRYRIDGIDQRSIAAELNVSLSTVEKDLRAAYTALLALKGDSDED